MALGKTPAKAEGINLNLGRAAWVKLIELSTKILIITHFPENGTEPGEKIEQELKYREFKMRELHKN